MRSRNRSLSLVNLCILVVCGLSILRADNSEQVSVAVGDEFTVDLASIPGAGCSWVLTGSLPKWLEQVDKTYIAAKPGLVGGGASERWKFRATASGSATLTFQYERPGEGPPTKVHVCQVTAASLADIENILMATGEEFTVALASNRSTDYSWTLAGSLPSWLEQVGKTYIAANPGLPGGGGAEYWTFRAAATGSATLTFQYGHPREGPPIKMHLCKITVTPATDTENIFAVVGEDFTVALASNPSTGYSWVLIGSLPSWLKQVDKTYVAGKPGLPGGGGTEYWKFRATTTGSATLTFQYIRPWLGTPVNVHVCQVTAAPATDPSLVLYLPFNEGTGATVHDLSRYHHRGTIAGATWVPGQSGTALEFADGSHVMVPALPAYDVTSAVSLLAWVKATTNPVWSCVVDKSEDPISGFSLCLTADSGGLPRFEFCVNGTIAAMTSKTVVLDGQWHFVAATVGNKTLRLYVDGRKEAEVPSLGGADIKPNHCPVMIGGSAGLCHVQQYYGSLDEVAMYNRELSADEVLVLFQKGTNGTPSTCNTRGDRTEPRPAGST